MQSPCRRIVAVCGHHQFPQIDVVATLNGLLATVTMATPDAELVLPHPSPPHRRHSWPVRPSMSVFKPLGRR
jgi:hypothetical protein